MTPTRKPVLPSVRYSMSGFSTNFVVFFLLLQDVSNNVAHKTAKHMVRIV